MAASGSNPYLHYNTSGRCTQGAPG